MTWEGQTAPAAEEPARLSADRERPLRTWVGVGGSPESVVRAARYDLPLALAIIGGDPERFRPYVDLYHRAFAQLGRPVQPIAVHSPGYVAETDEQAREEYWPGYKGMHDRIGAERGWPPMERAAFDQEVERGALHVGAPETVARKITTTAKALGIVRFDMKYSAGTLAHEKLMRCIELYGTQSDAAGAGDAGAGIVAGRLNIAANNSPDDKNIVHQVSAFPALEFEHFAHRLDLRSASRIAPIWSRMSVQ